MLCEKCLKNHATTHIKSVINGVVYEMNLCSECAQKSGYGNIGHNSLSEMLASMLGEGMVKRLSHDEKSCSFCKTSFADIAKTGKVGCANCYEEFKSELLPYLKRIHDATKHTGKVPNSAPLIVRPQEESVEALKAKLASLVAEEKYEEAAVIRDKIKEKESEINE